MKIWILLFLIMAAIYDYRDFKIPNKLNGTVSDFVIYM